MDRALYSGTLKLIAVAQYIDLEGPKFDSLGRRRVRALVSCPACDEPVHPVSEGTINRDQVWGHNPNPHGPWCPIKDVGGAKYSLLTPTAPDAAKGAALRDSFLKNWQIHWSHVLNIAPMADIHSFTAFIHQADRNKFWQYAELQEWHIPYIFLALCDFPPPKSKKAARVRPEWLRFRFDAKVRTFEDLWIRTTGTWRFLRMRFRKPLKGEPGPRHYIDCELVLPDESFLSKPFRSPNSYQLDAMKKCYGV